MALDSRPKPDRHPPRRCQRSSMARRSRFVGYGTAVVTVTGGGGATATGNVEVSPVAPSLFAMPGGNVASAVGLRATAAGVQSPVEIFQSCELSLGTGEEHRRVQASDDQPADPGVTAR